MLQIKHLTITMKRNLKILVDDFSLSVMPGDKCAVVGEEGNGKSTLLKWINDMDSVSDYAICKGERFKGDLIFGYLSQEVSEMELSMPVMEYCAQHEAFENSTVGEIAKCAKKLDFPIDLFYSDQLIHTLSGGEKVKLRLAMILLKAPDILLLDEPSNDLDIETLTWLERFIHTCPQATLYISHDETLLERTATVIVHIEQLRRKTLPRHTIERIDYASYVKKRELLFTRQMQTAKKEEEEYEKKMARYQQIYQRVQHEQSAVSRQDPHSGRLLKKKMKAVKALETRYEREGENRTELPDAEEAIMVQFDADIAMPSGKTVLSLELQTLNVEGKILTGPISLHVKGGERIAIIGRNGVGKTTLIKQIADTLLARNDIKAAYMPQNYNEQVDLEMTPVDFLAVDGKKESRTKAQTILGSMKYTPEEFTHPIAELSGGQKAKLYFTKMIIERNDVLILDEPTRNLSPLSSPVIREMLARFKGAIISVSHDRKYLAEVCNSVYRLTKGGLVKVNEKC